MCTLFPKRSVRRTLPLALLALSASVCAARDVGRYERVEEVMTNDVALTNPFTQTELRLRVAAPAGRKLGPSFTWRGFHDGDGAGGQRGNVWKFRLLFDQPGTWTVEAGFYEPDSLRRNGPSRVFVYEVTDKSRRGDHGHVRVHPENRLRLSCDDGTPWVPFAMHSSGLLGRDRALARRWIDGLADLGVDALSVRFHTEAYGDYPGRFYYLLHDGTPATRWPVREADAFDYSRFDLATWRHAEDIIAHAEARGVKLSIWFGISGLNRQYQSYGPLDHPDDAVLGPLQKLFIRYFLARWAPFTLWWHWTIDSEYEETGPGCLRRVRTWAAMLRAENPWKTALTTHVLSDWSPKDAPELDLATIQRRVIDTDEGATDCRQFITQNLRYHRPVYNAEGVWRLENAARSRIATWAHLMAGGYSNLAHMGTRRGPRRSRGAASQPAPASAASAPSTQPGYSGSWEVTWDRFNPRGKEDAIEIGRLSLFFNRTPGIDISRCVPHDELVSVEGGHLAMCLAEPGQSYYVWLDQGGAASLNLAGCAGRFRVRRYRGTDLSNPAALPAIRGGGFVELGATPTAGFGEDYLWVVTKSE